MNNSFTLFTQALGLGLLFATYSTNCLRGQIPTHPAPPSQNAGDRIDAILTRIAIENMPTEFSDQKDWGKQSEKFDRLDFERDGLKIETRRKRKMVNHGTWKKWHANLRDPNDEFQIQIKNIRETVDGTLSFEIHVAAHLDLHARVAKWRKGIQLYSFSAEGHTKLKIVVHMEMGASMGISNFPPDMILEPLATDSEISIDEFRIDRVSKIGGEFAQQITRSVRPKLEDKTTDYERKLVKKINKQIEKNQAEFRLSIADAMESQWSKTLANEIPPRSGKQKTQINPAPMQEPD